MTPGNTKRASVPMGIAMGIAALLLPALMALAQEELADPEAAGEKHARYTVEVIIFTYEDPSSAGNEIFAPPAPLPDAPFGETILLEEAPVFDDRSPRPGQRPAAEGAAVGPLGEMPARARIELQRLEPERFRMKETYRKLRQLDAYRPILHAAWTQTTHDKSVSPALPLRTLSDPPLGLDGSINLYQSRFLHLDVELTLDATDDDGRDSRRAATDRLVNRDDRDGNAEDTFVSDEPDATQSPPVRYRITENRIMRDGDVRYFDHPRFGMIAKVSRVDDDEAATAAE